MTFDKLCNGVLKEALFPEASNFVAQAKKKADLRDETVAFGVSDDGKHYAVFIEYDKYDDGDRWIEETNYRLEKEGEGKHVYISDEKGKELMARAREEYPDLNTHLKY